MEQMENVAETASHVLALGDCADLFVSCIIVGMLVAVIPLLIGLMIHVVMRILNKA